MLFSAETVFYSCFADRPANEQSAEYTEYYSANNVGGIVNEVIKA